MLRPPATWKTQNCCLVFIITPLNKLLIDTLQRLQDPNLQSVETNLQFYVLLCKTHFNIITHLRQYLSGDFSTYFFEDRRSSKLRSPKLYIEDQLQLSRTKISSLALDFSCLSFIITAVRKIIALVITFYIDL